MRINEPTPVSQARGMAKQEFGISSLASTIPTEADAYLLLEELLWGDTPAAGPKCGVMARC